VHPANAGNGKRRADTDPVGEEVFASAARAWRRQLRITAEHRAPGSDERYNASLHVLTSAPDTTRLELEDVLRARTKRFTLTGIVPGDGGSAVTLKYRVFVRRSARDELIDAIRTAPQTVGVELR
jgi:hypothetical protein